MNIRNYLKRINVTKEIVINRDMFYQLHENHVLNVPFENLDIHYKRKFDLAIDKTYKKVVIDNRGGFCYELNSLFNFLLINLGFKSRIVSARIFDDSGNLGPEYDHMSLLVEIDKKKYLADVGFGDLFIKPIEISEGIQTDGRNYFKVETHYEKEFVLSMSSNQIDFHNKYMFYLKEVSIDKFYAICLDKQTNPSSYFVKNTLCTKPTAFGRLTLFNNKLIEKIGDERIEKVILDDVEFRKELINKFKILIK